MESESDPQSSPPSGPGRFSEALEEARQRAERKKAELLAQDPADIDLVGQIDQLPRLVLDVLVGIREELNPESRAALEEWQDAERRRARELWEMVERKAREFRSQLPPNWNSPEVAFPGLEVIERLQLDEGLPLAWLPPNSVLARLLQRRTPGARLKLIAEEAPTLLAAIRKELRRLRAAETREWRLAAREALSVMEGGYWRAGQALAAVALDTLTNTVVRPGYEHATKHSRKGPGGVAVAMPPGSGEGSLPTWRDVDYPRALLVLYGIFGAFGEYNSRGGDPVPAQFTRHATVHSMGHPQYNKANALIALMHLVSLLCLVEDNN